MVSNEVAALRARIDSEIEALQRLREYAQTASHEMIMHHYRALDTCHAQLAAEIGEVQATEMICERLEQLL